MGGNLIAELLHRRTTQIQNLKPEMLQNSNHYEHFFFSFGFWSISDFQIWDAQSVKSMQIFQNLKKLPKV
jgi:hypothetical protein